MVIKQCPKCGANTIKVHTKYGYDVSFDIKKSNQNIICPNCKRKISFLVVPIDNPQVDFED